MHLLASKEQGVIAWMRGVHGLLVSLARHLSLSSGRYKACMNFPWCHPILKVNGVG